LKSTRHYNAVLCTLLVVCLAYGPYAKPLQQGHKQNGSLQTARKGTTASASKPSSTVGKVVDVTGTVTVMRPSFKKPVKVSRNMQIFQNDKIKVEALSSVSVICLADLRQYDWLADEHTIDCHPKIPLMQGYAERFNRAKEVIDIVTDSSGHQTTRPKGTSPQNCLVAIIKSRPALWGTSISLKPNNPLMDSGEVDALEKQIADLKIDAKTDQASEDVKRLLQADLHALWQDYEGARGFLADITEADQDPYIQMMLGDLYCADGLGMEGKTAYQQALAAAEKRQDVLAQAVAHHAIGYFQSLVEDLPIAKNKEVDTAVKLYKEIGDDQTAVQLISQLKAAWLHSK
jgi:hypothetical protein